METGLIITLFVIASVAKALADLSAEGKIPWGTPMYWDKNISWIYKYSNASIHNHKYFGGELKPRFFGSTSFLVFLVDGWHLMNFIHFSSIQLLISVLLFDGWHILVSFVGMKMIFGTIMEITRRVVE